jgi:Putative transposase/Transposase zinc-binding domain
VAAFVYERRRPERTTLYAVVRDNIETLYAATAESGVELPRFVRAELEGYLDCGLLCRGFAHLRCEGCRERRLVAFTCKGRGFCPSCMGRRMAQTAANLMTSVLPEAPLRQWVLTVPHAIRYRLAYDAKLLGTVVRAFVGAVLAFYKKRCGASGAVAVVQRTSSDLRCNPHVHAVFLDGGYRGDGEEFTALGHLRGSDVAEVLAKAKRRIERVLARAAVRTDDESELPLLASVSGRPPAGPALRRGAGLPMELPEGKLCVSDDGYNLHAATTAGAADARGREALLRYILRPPVAQERIASGPSDLVRIVLKKPFSDGTVAIDLDPLSLLLRLCAAVPAPRFHTTRYCGVLASASKLRPKIIPKPATPAGETEAQGSDDPPKKKGCRYWPWAELMARSFHADVTVCPSCGGRLKLVALVQEMEGVARFLRRLGEPSETPRRAPARAPPYYRSAVIRRLATGDLAVA